MNESRQNTGRGRPRVLSEKEIERWQDTYGEDIQIVDYKKRAIKYSLIARERGLISEDEEFAYFLLYGSVIRGSITRNMAMSIIEASHANGLFLKKQ
ncbi:hypothetical protein [Paenibacillus polymyxa]|uniref:hypothetical protein n=1 Tax=Paenibacillus polymyxa TaxID=1406 RepID=UPI0025B68F30|nr:hypothetical protein [Paenibacillus polymyxa]MDN4086172.1 hypothetical protein [Paenibacillus polymyxa]MDN4108692.1 hypothetical protein [Paenibacillus polymyxa]